MKDYLVVAIRVCEGGNTQIENDIIKAESKYDAFTKYHENREPGQSMIVNIVCLTD